MVFNYSEAEAIFAVSELYVCRVWTQDFVLCRSVTFQFIWPAQPRLGGFGRGEVSSCQVGLDLHSRGDAFTQLILDDRLIDCRMCQSGAMAMTSGARHGCTSRHEKVSRVVSRARRKLILSQEIQAYWSSARFTVHWPGLGWTSSRHSLIREFCEGEVRADERYGMVQVFARRNPRRDLGGTRV